MKNTIVIKFQKSGVFLPSHSIVLFLILLTALTACSEEKEDPKVEQTPVYTVITDGTLNIGDKIPVPTGEIILTITGSVKNTNQGDSIIMDLSTIEAVGEVEYMVTDPFEEEKITYRGVLMSDLVALWEIDPNATTLSVLALNDYAVDVPLKDVLNYPVIFAMQRNGEYMPVSTRGPAMLVFPYDDFEFDTKLYNDYWAWQIKSITVK